MPTPSMIHSSFLRRCASACAILLALGATQAAHADNFIVTNANDSGAGSLRQAIINANATPGDDSISFEKPTFDTPHTITLTSGEMVIANSGQLFIGANNITIDASDASRIFNIQSPSTVSISGFTFVKGRSSGNGGAILSSGNLALRNCTFANNNVAPGGGGGAVANIGGTLTINGGAFNNNANFAVDGSTGEATGIGGGAIYNAGTATVSGLTFLGNISSRGVGGAIFNNDGCSLSVSKTNFVNNNTLTPTNQSAGSGSAIQNEGRLTVDATYISGGSSATGGGIANVGGEASFTNCSFYGNRGFVRGGAISNAPSQSDAATLSLESCTMIYNLGSVGAAIYSQSEATLNVSNSIVAKNDTNQQSGSNISGTIAAGDYNLIDVTAGATLSGTHNIIGQDPRIDGPHYYGGPSQVFRIAADSPAVDAGKSALTVDQRGGKRPRDIAGVPNAEGGNASDIGAFEYEPSQTGPNFVVNSTSNHNDSECSPDDCTLSEAVFISNNVPGANTITFDPVVFARRQTITLDTISLSVSSEINIIGPTVFGTGVTINSISAPFSGITVLQGPLTVSNLTFQGRTAGISSYRDTLTVNSCTFIGCRIGVQNGTSALRSSVSTINNSTFVGCTYAAIECNRSNLSNVVNINSCTIANNNYGLRVNGDTVNLSNSLVVGNSNANINNVAGTVNSDYSITTGTSADAGLDPKGLGYNGGPTQTIALMPGSPAIDQGNTTLTTEQRGLGRPSDLKDIPNAQGGNGSDMGAFELNEEPTSGLYLVVNTADDHDDGVCGAADCSLREAINLANVPNGARIITFDYAVFGGRKTTIFIKGEAPVIRSNVGILAPFTEGSGVTIENPNATSGYALRIENASPNLTYLTLKGYNALFNGAGGQQTTTAESCTFIGRNVGIQSYSNMQLSNCTVTGSQASGILNRSGTLSLIHCTVAGNNQGLNIEAGSATLTNTLIAGNTTNLAGLAPVGGTNNITAGTATEVGLATDQQGNALLADNGGRTPTIALLAGSLAINGGTGSVSYDQRGVRRDFTPDIGAYEFVPPPSYAPSVVSLAPLGATDKVGTKRTFTLTVSDANGIFDINEAWLMINERLSWNGGATLIYVPSATSPTSGLLYLRAADGLSFLPAMQIGVGASTKAALDNGAINVLARDVKVTTSGNSITLNLPLTIRDGLVGVNRLFARVVDKNGALDPTAGPGDNGYRRFGNYIVQPQFAGETNSAPILSKLTPTTTNTALTTAGLGPVQQFSFFAVDENGTGDIESVWFSAGKQRNWTNSATFIYTPRTRRLVLRSDDGNSFLGGGIIGTPGIIENSQVRVDLSKVRVLTYGDGKTLGIILPVQAKRGLLGQNKVWLRVQDNQRATAPNGDEQGYVQSGTWNVVQGSTPAISAFSAAGS
ncbi:CSLREA domain-containing protein [bacterium]|nr:MAG: CSLREA domain-containing protein [bacterium]